MSYESSNVRGRVLTLFFVPFYLYYLVMLVVQAKGVSPWTALAVVSGGALAIMVTLVVFGAKSIKQTGPVRRFQLNSIFLIIIPLSVYLAAVRWMIQGLPSDEFRVRGWLTVVLAAAFFMFFTTIVLIHFTDAVLWLAVICQRALAQTTGHQTAMPASSSESQILAETRFLRLMRCGRWDFVQRTTGRVAVALVATTNDQRLLFVEQHRIPVDGPVIELPAGLVGDLPGEDGEALETAARRELLEETGYEADRLERLVLTASSAGLTDESVMLMRARDVRRVGPGGGDGSEDITVHAVPLAEVDAWLDERIAAGHLVDGRVLAAVYFVRRGL
jgi:ADP-ribose pyrophosphatase